MHTPDMVIQTVRQIRHTWSILPTLGKHVLRHPVSQNVASLLLIHAVNYILPLVTTPYLARVLLPSGWGEVLFAQSFAVWLAIIVEYGFLFSATRDVARQAGSPDTLEIIVNSVNGAKGLLTLVATLIAIIAWGILPQFQQTPLFLLFAWLTAVFQGLYPMWYFQGVLRMRRLAVLSTITRIIATGLTFPLVRNPTDGWIVLALQATATVAATLIALIWLYQEIPMRRPQFGEVMKSLYEGKYMFTVSLAAGVYGLAGSFFVGLFTNPVQVGFYGGAERIHRIMTNLFAIASQALYPYMSQIVHVNPVRSVRLVRILFTLSCGAGLVLAAVTIAVAPQLVRIILGPGFEPAALILQIMALQLTLTGISRILGVQWMLPLGMDRQFNYLVIGGGLFNLVLIVLMVPAWQSVGMAIAFVLTETLIAVGMIWVLQRSGYAFWRRGNRLLQSAAGSTDSIASIHQ